MIDGPRLRKAYFASVSLPLGLLWLCFAGCGAGEAQHGVGAGASSGGSGAGNSVGGLAGVGGSIAAGGLSATGGVSSGGLSAAGGVSSGDLSAAGGVDSGGASATGGVSSGGASSAGGVNSGGASATGSACAPRPGLLFCDDFEADAVGAAPPAPWTTSAGTSDTVSIEDSANAHSGRKSVHVHAEDYQTFLSYHDAQVLPQANGKFFVRAFVRFDMPMTMGHNTFILADTFAAPNMGNAARVGEMNQMLMMTAGGDAHGWLSNQNYYNDAKPGVQFAAGAYTCLELLFDAPNTEIDVWVNGAEVPDLHISDISHENYDFLHFGFEKYAGPASDFWFDDIAVGTQQIGCN